MKRKLVILGASSDQRFLYETAKAMDLEILAVDRNADSPCFELADDTLAVSTRDVNEILRGIDERVEAGQSFHGVTTMGSDIPDVVAQVAEHLGLPHVGFEAAVLATDKLAMKRRFQERGVPIPWFAEVTSSKEVREHLHDHERLVLKPVDRSGSRGVYVLDARSDVEQLFAQARDQSYTGKTMVEEFLEGPQISTETVLAGDAAVTPGYADRNYELFEEFLPQVMENGGWVPSLSTPEQRAEVETLVEEAARAIGMEHGIAKGDVVWTEDGPKVIEIAARLSGGDFSAGIVPWGCGVNYVRTQIELALGDQPDLDVLRPRYERVVANRYFFPEPGRLVAVEGVERVLLEPWLHKFELWYEPGDVVPASTSHATRFGVFLVTGPDRETVQERIDFVYDTVRIRTEARTRRAA